eukprot:TRINITY_DN25068_c0_g1_i2.p1 TRINITY_DN25068_c0_g1~~TRINITY_DN25068_c0_g1_i2.p1  ORF type:complete len:604 (-),score=91.43 TRINITY_DN25068_c0_g1_i2:139-1950(-)
MTAPAAAGIAVAPTAAAACSSRFSVGPPPSVINAFRRYDPEKIGLIDRDGMERVLRRIAPHVPENAVRAVVEAGFREGVHSSSTSLSYEDFIAWMYGAGDARRVLVPPSGGEVPAASVSTPANVLTTAEPGPSPVFCFLPGTSEVELRCPALSVIDQSETVGALRRRAAAQACVPAEHTRFVLGFQGDARAQRCLFSPRYAQQALTPTSPKRDAAAAVLFQWEKTSFPLVQNRSKSCLLDDDETEIACCGVSVGAALVLVSCPRIVGSILSGAGSLHETLNGTIRADALCVDWDADVVFFAHRGNQQLGRLELQTQKSAVITQLPQAPRGICLAPGGNELFVTTAGTKAGRFRDGKLLSVDIASGTCQVLLEQLHFPNAVAVMPAMEVIDGDPAKGAPPEHRIFFVEAADAFAAPEAVGGRCALCEYTKGKRRCIRELDFSPSGGLAVIDRCCRRFVVGSRGRLSGSVTCGEVYVVSAEAADGESWLSIAGGLSANEALALDASGCLYCAGSAPSGAAPGLEAFPGFASAAEHGLPTILRATADEEISIRRGRRSVQSWQAAKGLAVNPRGNVVYYSTVRDTLRLARIQPAAGALFTSSARPA